MIGIGISLGLGSGGIRNIVAPLLEKVDPAASGYAGTVYTTNRTDLPLLADGVEVWDWSGGDYVQTVANEGKALSQTGSNVVPAMFTYDADASRWASYDTWGASSYVKSGTSLTQLTDLTGNARHLVQTIGSEQAQFGINTLAGRDVPNFASDWAESTSFVLPSSGNISIHGLMSVDGGDGDGKSSIMSMDGTTTDWQLQRGTSPATVFSFFTAGGISGASDTVVRSGWLLISIEFDFTAGVYRVYFNSALAFESSYDSKISSPTAFKLFANRAGDLSVHGNFAQMTLSESVAAASRQKYEGQLAHRWNMVANLPAAHPYKSAPPTVTS